VLYWNSLKERIIMADNNNANIMNLPTEPHPKLKELAERLVGKWRVKGPNIDGDVEFELM
jgi:hypothetical protein